MDINQPNRIDLPNGNWADLRPVGEVSERLRRPIKRLTAKLASYPDFMRAVDTAQSKKKLTQADQLSIASAMGDSFDVLEELQDRLVIAAVRGWSFPQDITVDGLLDIPCMASDALREAAAPYQSALNPDMGPSPEADSPTGPSGA